MGWWDNITDVVGASWGATSDFRGEVHAPQQHAFNKAVESFEAEEAANAAAQERRAGSSGPQLSPWEEALQRIRQAKEQAAARMTPAEHAESARKAYKERMAELAKERGAEMSDINPDTGLTYQFVPYVWDAEAKKRRYGTTVYGSAGIEDGDAVVSVATAAQSEWTDMTSKEVNAAKKRLYEAGYYGDEKPILGAGAWFEDDEKAMYAAMVDANRNGVTWDTLASRMAAKGVRAAGEDGGEKPEGLSPEEIDTMRKNIYSNFEQFAYNNGIKLADSWKEKTFVKIATGQTDPEAVFQDLRETTVASAFPAYEDRIKAGYDVMDIAGSYIGAKATLLELNDADVDLFDGQIRRALQGNMSLADFEDQVRRDPRYATTADANRVADDYISQFDQIFRM